MDCVGSLGAMVAVLTVVGGACSSNGLGNGSGGSSTPALGGGSGAGGSMVGTGGAGQGGFGASSTASGTGAQPGSGGTSSVPGGGGSSTMAAGAGGRGSGGSTAITTIPSGGSSDAGRDASESTGGRSGTGGGTTVDGGPASAGGGSGASAGCGSSNTTSACGVKGTTCTLDVSGTSRTYYVQLPSSYNSSKQYPIIFQFHPWGGSADQALTLYQLNAKIPDAIYVTPQGLDAGGNGPGWANTNGQDIAFTKAMLADVQAKYCSDNARIFSVGFSYGGMMSFAIGCEMSNVFRAIAPMSGSLYSDFNCKGSGPHVAMWGSHGLNDTVVPIADGRAARDKILQQNHCGTMTTAVDPSPCMKYQGCDSGYDVTWCEWDGPHGIPSFGSSAIAAFFKQF